MLREKKNLYESILVHKSKLDVLIDTVIYVNEAENDERLKIIRRDLALVNMRLDKYNFRHGLAKADAIVNKYMNEIGKYFEFEESYLPVNLKFSFETFDLYYESFKGEKIFLRSMGSGANWLYSHVTLFLALHKYFASLGEHCAIPSIIFFDQPTQVYFPSFKFDKSESFDTETISKLEGREEGERQVDDDMAAVENLFSRLSVYCTEVANEFGFSPQIIVTDHADMLNLSDFTVFESLVNGNRWRQRGLIDPVPVSLEKP